MVQKQQLSTQSNENLQQILKYWLLKPVNHEFICNRGNVVAQYEKNLFTYCLDIILT